MCPEGKVYWVPFYTNSRHVDSEQWKLSMSILSVILLKLMRLGKTSYGINSIFDPFSIGNL